jgi:hypothetical protein
MPYLSPKEESLFKEEIQRFNELYREGLEAAIARFEKRAPYYDVDRPIWNRVMFPEGLINEVVDKAARLQNAWQNYQEGNITPVEMWDKMIDEVPDIINYSAFLRSIILIFREQEAELRSGSVEE